VRDPHQRAPQGVRVEDLAFAHAGDDDAIGFCWPMAWRNGVA
jgi:hypothetical protein